jgi:hypothetical protein
VSVTERSIRGNGLAYDAYRQAQGQRSFVLPFDDIALVETNEPQTVFHSGLIVMGVVTGATLAVAAVCLANPKTCFGSCPTFYADPDAPPLAEGFSQSIARTLETTDVDALPASLGEGRSELSLWMKNEALETHVVRSVRLLAVPSADGAPVLRAGARYFPAVSLSPPDRCSSPGGDCRGALAAADGRQYLSATDPADLAAPETLELSFETHPAGELAVAVRARNSLVETYVFYQLLAYQGLASDEWFLALEKAGRAGKELVDRMSRPLRAIDVEAWDGKEWIRAGEFAEVGPLAWDEVAIPLPRDLPAGPVRVRLNMAKGSWKIDRVALAALGPAAAPISIDVHRVQRDGQVDPTALARLRDGSALVTYPGDAYRLEFELPPGRHQLFLESRGYYYEWIRQAWLAEESPQEFTRALSDPRGTLKRLAPGYKKIEPEMERLFWHSRLEAH